MNVFSASGVKNRNDMMLGQMEFINLIAGFFLDESLNQI
jgi:hypothetical protein